MVGSDFILISTTVVDILETKTYIYVHKQGLRILLHRCSIGDLRLEYTPRHSHRLDYRQLDIKQNNTGIKQANILSTT